MGGSGTSRAEDIRKAMTTVMAAGYDPDVVVLNPAQAEELDILSLTLNNTTGIAPAFGLQLRISKSVTTGIVYDSRRFATLYLSATSFMAFEERSAAPGRAAQRQAALLHGGVGEIEAVRVAGVAERIDGRLTLVVERCLQPPLRVAAVGGIGVISTLVTELADLGVRVRKEPRTKPQRPSTRAKRRPLQRAQSQKRPRLL